MLLYVLLYIMLTYLMLFAALLNAVCLYNAFLPLTFANAFCFSALSWVIDIYLFILTLFSFNYFFASSTVLLMCWFS